MRNTAWNRLPWPEMLLIALLLTACGFKNAPSAAIQSQSITMTADQALVLQINTGKINISQSPNELLTISGTINAPDEVTYRVDQGANEITIDAEYHPGWLSGKVKGPIQISIQVPSGHKITINTFDAAIDLSNYTGNVDVTAVAGTITARNITGNASLKSNRGDIALSDSSGGMYVLGNYGILSLENVRGSVKASTIMGTIRFSGQVAAGDGLHFETDHGPVEIRLSPDSSSKVQIRSTSGNLACMLPGLTFSTRNCDGILGSGAGSLDVRTVSGDVTLQPGP